MIRAIRRELLVQCDVVTLIGGGGTFAELISRTGMVTYDVRGLAASIGLPLSDL